MEYRGRRSEVGGRRSENRIVAVVCDCRLRRRWGREKKMQKVCLQLRTRILDSGNVLSLGEILYLASCRRGSEAKPR